MKELWSRRCRSLTPYTPGEQPKKKMDRLIKLNTNENPYPPSPMALEAMRAVPGESLRLYPDPDCCELREGIAMALDVKPEQIFVGNGSDEVLSLAFQAFFDPDEPIRFADITYGFYPVFADFYGLSYETIPLDENFGLPVEPFLKPGGGIVVANPNAPTGRELSLCDIKAIVSANEHRVVVVDEAYVDFGTRSAIELVNSYNNLLIVRTFSKGRSLAGLRVGYAVGHKDLITAMHLVKDSFNSYPVDRVAQAAALGAIRDEEYFRCTTTKIISTRACTTSLLRSMGFKVCDSSSNFLFVTHETVPATVLKDELREQGILVRWWNKPRISNYLRISVGTDEEMRALCDALKEIIANYKA